MYRLLADKSAAFADATAYDFMGTKVSFKRFLRQIDRAARALKAYDVKRGDVVTVVSANIPEAIITIYAANKIGAVANVVHPLSSEADIRYALTLTGSKLLFVIDIAYATTAKVLQDSAVRDVVILSVRDSLAGVMRLGYNLTQGRKVGKIPSRHRQYSWREFLAQAHQVHDEVEVRTGRDDPAAVLYSGGTSGKPKGILLTNGNFNAHALQSNDFAPELHVGNSILGILPIFHGFGLSIGFHTMLCSGVTSIMLPKFDAGSFHKTLRNKRPNIILGVPTLFEAFVHNKKIHELDLSFIEFVICGGDAISNALKHECDKVLRNGGCRTEVMQGYGLTEFLAVASFGPQERVKLGSVGIPLADVFIKIVEPETDIEKPVGELGEIVITGPNMMRGYLNEDEETNRALVKHRDGHVWLHTGDLGHIDEEGYLFFEQRLKRMIVSSGYNVYPNHIEEVISGVDEVLLTTVVGVPDRYRGQVAKAFIVLKPGHKPTKALREKIMARCRENLPKYSLPRGLEFRDALPKTKLGKVAYTELK
jgi:long-chain acyl-CoA synthetase